MTPHRLLVVALLSGLACLLVVPFAHHRDGEPPTVRTAGPDRVAALAVLREWDRERAAAWRRGEPAALARLYLPGSGAGRADRALLAAYAGRGLRVTGMRMQLAAVVVESATPRRIELVVTDRLVGASAVGRRGRIGLPRDRWSRRRIVLVRAGESWRVGTVDDQVSIAASTASTSGSANS